MRRSRPFRTGRSRRPHFALPEGQVSGPCSWRSGHGGPQGRQGDAGQRGELREPLAPASRPTFGHVRLRTRPTRSARNSTTRVREASSVADAARKAGVAVLTVGPVTSTGLDGDGKPVTSPYTAGSEVGVRPRAGRGRRSRGRRAGRIFRRARRSRHSPFPAAAR